jgi:hypothetical protein
LKRIVLMGAAFAGLFTAGIAATASAATPATRVTKYATKTVHATATCKLALTTVAPPGSSAVEAGSPAGTNYGTSSCAGGKPGTARQVYTEDSAGDLTGKVQQWFATGTLYGTYTLTPSSSSGPPTTTTFGAASYSGTVTLTGAGGALKRTTGSGKMTCSTTDSVHYSCTESLKLTQTVKTLVPYKAKVREKVSIRA